MCSQIISEDKPTHFLPFSLNMFSSSTFDAIKIEVAKAYDYWALTPEVSACVL